ncbi:MAG: hypothetical protein IJ644_09170 [Oscillospiraceae bacterium]|nr:hypothetical protein [Oscillospiraceae bacterium]
MKILKLKRVLACLLSMALICSAGSASVFAEDADSAEDAAVSDEAVSEEDAALSEETISVEEEEEEFDASPDEVKAYMKSIGTADGYEVYLREDDYKDKIEADLQKKYKNEDELKDAVKDTEKHLKHAELALIDAESGKMAAELEEIASDKEQHIYFSEAGNYLVVLDADQKKIIKIRFRVSTLDSEYLFLTKDEQTLELYSTDYKSVRAEMQNVWSAGETTLYQNEDRSRWAVLDGNKTQVRVCVKTVAENDNFLMYYDEDTGLIGIENKKNNYTWWSSPPTANRDETATPLVVTDLQSSVVLTYGDSNSRGTTNLRSRNSAKLSFKETDKGLIITYNFEKCGITIPVAYELENDYMSVTVKCDDIKETMTDKGLVATQLTLLGSFGAGEGDEDGYFVIPDGCGSLIRFNNGKETTKSYSQKVYGRDITNVPTTKPAVTEEILMPVYGIVKKDNAMAVIIEKGDGNVSLNASVSGQSLSSFNTCNFTFQLRGSDTYTMSGDYGNLTVFEDGDIKTDTIKLRYYPIADSDASYMNIAETYRNYLLDDGNVTKKAQADSTELYLDLYGGTMKSRSVLGIPVTMKTSMTSYSEAEKIIAELSGLGVDDMSVIYNNWTNDGISGKVDYQSKPSAALGGAASFNKLTKYLDEQGYDFYPAVNNKTFDSGNGYYTFTDTTIRISNSYSRLMTYNLSYGVQNTNVKTKSLLSPGVFTELYQKLATNYVKRKLSGVCLGEMTSTVWGDYGKQNMSRDDTVTALQTSYQSIQDSGLSLLADTCAAYAFPYADKISDVPLHSSGFDIFDEEVPFYQLVMHGVLPYSSTAINASADSTDSFLTAVATGCNPAYDMIYAEASDLKDTLLDSYYYSHYAFWTDTAAQEYKLAKDVLSKVSDKVITDYIRENDISVTTYEDGTQVVVDYAEKSITANGIVYKLADAEKGA